MSEHLKKIREGFLKAIGAHLYQGVCAGLLVLGGWAIRFSLPGKQVSSIERAGYMAAILVFAVAWWAYYRRMRTRVSQLHGEVSCLRSGLVIYSASYGAGDSTADVAPYLLRQIAEGRRKIPVGNSLLDGAPDPCPNAKKDAVVEYSRPGKREIQTVKEDCGYFDFTQIGP